MAKFHFSSTTLLSQTSKKKKKRFLDQEKLKFLKDTCKVLEEAGIISIVDQPVYTSNIVLVPKYKTFRDNFKASSIGKNKEKKEVASYRLTQDLRGLNGKTISTAKTISVVQEAFINRLSNKLVTSLEMTSAYFQIELSEDSKPLTSFYVDTVTYQWNCLTQGLVAVPTSFTLMWNMAFNKKVLSSIKSTLPKIEGATIP